MDENALLLEKINKGSRAAFEEMTQRNMPLVRSVARAYRARGCDAEDLLQIGAIGLIKAIRRFDISLGVKFSTYAVPMISGEIRRFLRDDGMIKISRSIKETAYKCRRAEEKLKNELGRMPTINEISQCCGIACEEAAYALEACSDCTSIDEIQTKSVSHEDETIDRLLISEGISSLSGRERQVIILRYFKSLTQSKIAEMLGISQVQVSRIEKKAICRIKAALTGEA